MQFLWKYVDDLVGKGLGILVLMKLMFYASATFVPLALPLAVLLSSLMTFGNMGEHYELVSIKSSGISLQKAMQPLIILAVLISIGAFLFSNYVFPVANLKFGSLLYDVRQKKLAFNLEEGIFDNELNGYVLRVGRKAKDNKTIYDVMIYDHTNRMGDTKVTVAKRGIMELSPNQKHLVISLFDGYNYNEVVDERGYRQTHPFEQIKFKKQILSFDLTQLDLNHTNESLFKNHYSMLNIKQLNHAIDSISSFVKERKIAFEMNSLRGFDLTKKKEKPAVEQKKGPPKETKIAPVLYPFLRNFKADAQNQILGYAQQRTRNAKDNVLFHVNKIVKPKEQLLIRHEIVWNQKFKLSLACLIFFFIGAPLGAIIRKGGLGLPVVVSVIFFVLYHVISVIGEKSARTGDMSVVAGVWLSTMVILPLGLFLTYKAVTDSQLLDTESWQKYFEKHAGVKKILDALKKFTSLFKKKKSDR
jgi:lipopolysaccharide export system permease protein